MGPLHGLVPQTTKDPENVNAPVTVMLEVGTGNKIGSPVISKTPPKGPEKLEPLNVTVPPPRLEPAKMLPIKIEPLQGWQCCGPSLPFSPPPEIVKFSPVRKNFGPPPDPVTVRVPPVMTSGSA